MSERIVTANDRYARDIGFDYGNSTNDTQAQLFNGFAAGLKLACKGNIDTQICYIVDQMDASARQVFKTLAEYVEEAGK